MYSEILKLYYVKNGCVICMLTLQTNNKITMRQNLKIRQTVGTQHTFANIHKIADRDYDIDLSTIKIKFNIAKRRLRHQH